MKFLKILCFFLTIGIFQFECNGKGKTPNPGTATSATSCFIDTGIQVLFYTQPFREFIEKAKKEKYYADGSAPAIIMNFIDQLAHAKEAIKEDPKKPQESFRSKITETKSFKKYKKQAGGPEEQGDAGEFLESMLDSFTFDVLPAHKLQVKAKLDQMFAWRIFTLRNSNSTDLNDFVNEEKEAIGQGNYAILPDIMAIKFDRSTGVDPQTFEALPGKSMREIEFPLKGLKITTKDHKENTYNLYAIICHSGDAEMGFLGGHYWMYARNKDGQWYYYNNAPAMYAPAGYAATGAPQALQSSIAAKYPSINALVENSKKDIDSGALVVMKIDEKDMQAIAHQEVEKGFPYLLFYQRSDWKPEEEKPEEPKTGDKTGVLSNALGNLKKKLSELAAVLGTIAKKS